MNAISTLERCEIFLGLDNKDLQRIVALPSCQERIYQPQEVIFRAGEDAEHVYVIEEGKVDLIVRISANSSSHREQTVLPKRFRDTVVY